MSAINIRRVFHLDRALLNPEVLNKILVWREDDPRFAMRTKIRRTKMQRQFTIELRVDYADNEKNEAMRESLLKAARHCYATACLLADSVQPQIAIFSDDFYSGHEELKLLEDLIAKGEKQLEDHGVTTDEGEEISSELLSAVRT